MEALISEACRRPLDDIRNVQYDLEGPGREFILPSTWDLTIQAGWTVSIHFVDQSQSTPSDEYRVQQANQLQRLEDRILQQEDRASGWEQEREQQQRDWETARTAEGRQWQAERQRDRERWERDRERERQVWEEEMQRRLVERVALVHGTRRDKSGYGPGDLCGLSPCICWLSGKSRVCKQR
jgi:hypothetical protein